MKKGILHSRRIVLVFFLVATWTVANAQLCIPPIVTIQPVSNTICVGGISLFTVVAVGTNLSYQWQVDSGSGFVNCVNGGVYSGALTATLRVTGSAGMNGNKYRCRVSNSCGSALSNLCILTIPTITAVCTPSVICNGASATLSASGGLSYLWSTGATASSIVVTPATTTTYSITGTTILGCTSTTSVTVTVNPKPNVTVTASPSSICAGASSTLTASGASTYQWSTGQTGSSITVTPGATTTYSVTGTNTLGCSKTASVTVTVNPLPNVTISGPVSICTGSFATLTASGANTYLWSTGQTGPSIVVSPSSTQTYSVTGTSSFGCSKSASKTITVNPSPTVTATASPGTICGGGTSLLTAQGATSYVWSTGQTGQSISVSPGQTTTYQVTGTNNFGCSRTASVTVVVNPSPQISVSATDPELCPGGFTFLTASGASSYVWSTGETGSQIGVSPSQTITYQVTGTDNNGCSGSAEFTVTVGPVVTVTATDPEICPGGFTFLTANGASTYLWSTGETGSQIGVSPTQTTTYQVTGTDDSGCSASVLFTVTVGGGATVTVTATDPELCPGGFTFLTASGATSYLWSTGETGAQIGVSPSQTTTYEVTGTDNSGCSSTASITISIGPILTVTATDPELCPGGFTFLNASGADSYLWSTGETGSQIGTTLFQTTTYDVTGTVGECSATASITITVIDCSSGRERTGIVAAETETTEVSVYPNPSSGVFYIQGSPEGAVTEVFNSIGQRVLINIVDKDSAIDLAEHSTGTYLVKIKHQGTLIYQARIIKK